jgi:hypothetical protein
MKNKKISALLLTVLLLLAMPVSVVLAGNPHFVEVNVTRDGNSLTASGKEAGLGDETQVHIVLSASAACINPGSNHPKAANKEAFSTAADVPVQNGKAAYTLFLTATFQPDCSPPMTVSWTDISLTDTTNNITLNIPGTFP